jgi:ketosteroid isomerase-like protein
MSSDRLEIQDLIARYAHAVDRHDWDALDHLFTPDCRIDYTAMGGIAGDLASVKAYLAETMPMFVSTQHMMGLPVIDLDGDTATAVTICHNPLVLSGGDDPQVLICALWYHHQLIRTPEGWRINDLTEERCYMKTLKGKIN